MQRNIPEPSYEYEIGRLVAAYKDAVGRIKAELERMELSGLSNANARVALAEIARILSSLNDDSAQWVKENIPLAARDGVARTLLALELAKTADETASIVKFNRINANMVASAVADTQADLLAVTTNIDRKVRAAVRKAVADSMRANMAAGINGRKTIGRDILGRIRQELGSAAETGLIDAAGRRWKPEVYADMVTRTKMAATYNEATTNEAIQREAYYAVISSHGATDACGKWEGRIIRLTAEAPGNYPTYDEAKATGEIWHPNCRHTYTPVRKPELL
jgi:hypothetical protein